MNLKRILSLLSAVALLSTLVACGNGGSGKTSSSLDSESVAVRVGNAGIAPTATVNTGAGATTDKQIVLGTGTGATVTIPAGTGLFNGLVPVPGTPKITANVTSYIGALPAGVPTTGLVTTNGNVTVRVAITTDTGLNVDGFSTPLTVKLQTGMAPGSVFNYYSFNGVTWVLEGSVIVAGDGTVTFAVTHLSDWTAVGTETSTASASVQTAQKVYNEPAKAVEELIVASYTATTLSDLRVATKAATINVAAGTFLFSSLNLPLGKSVEKVAENGVVISGNIDGQPTASLSATSYMTYLPTSIASTLPTDFDILLSNALDKQVGLGGAVANNIKPIAVLTLDAKAGSTKVASIISSQFSVLLKASPTLFNNYICLSTYNNQDWQLMQAGLIGVDNTITITRGSLFKGGIGPALPIPLAIVCKDTALTGVYPKQ